MLEVLCALSFLIVMRGMGLELARQCRRDNTPPRSAEAARSGPNGEDAGSTPVGATKL